MTVLAGIRVVEFAGIGPGPFCGMLLADLGAEVIVIERPAAARDANRASNIALRGKKSIVLDLKKPADLDIALRLVERADGLIEGMRPGVMERLGLGPDICHARNPALVYGRVTGWGQIGPLAFAAGHDSNYTALSGALWFSSPPGLPQMAPSTLLGDIGGGALYLTIGLLAGILKARQGGAGQVVDAAIVDGSAHMLNLLLGLHARVGNGFERGHHAFDSSHWGGRSYRCADDEWINVAPREPQFYALFLKKLGLETDSEFAGGQHDRTLWPKLSERLEALFRTKTRDAWCQQLEGSDVCFAPVLRPDEAAAHSHLAERGTYQTIGGVLQGAPAPRFSVSPAAALSPVPEADCHRLDIVRLLEPSSDDTREPK